VNLLGANVLVLGLGDTGVSLARYLCKAGAHVVITDAQPQPSGLAILEESGLAVQFRPGFAAEDFARADVIATSPGVPTFPPAARAEVLAARSRGVPVVGDFELFGQALRALPEEERPAVIGVTGTNGKSTVTAMVGSMCKAAGLTTVVAGNIGMPVLDAWAEASTGDWPDVFAVELSSFQLETTESLDFETATVLNLTQDHLDRYLDMAAYGRAKASIFRNARVQVANRDDAATLAMLDTARDTATFGLAGALTEREWGISRLTGVPMLMRGDRPLVSFDDLGVTGLHNAANALAACALTSTLPVAEQELIAGLREFEGLPHRKVLVAEFGGVRFYDDSKGTNVGATIAALSGSERPVVLIAGGEGKSQNFAPLREAVLDKARAVVLIGRAADDIAGALKGVGRPVLRAESMAGAVLAAFEQAERGDEVLLSPACASFDMFRNYHHRGEVFASSVRELQRSQETGHAA
jgi:UDP-N-acetylmuramoylalanine--D-glutamate ligase